MKEVIELIKKLWSNKRYRAVAVLLIYVIFFTFVFMLISSGSKIPVEKPWDIRDVKEYQYEIQSDNNYTVFVKEETTILYNDVIYKLDEIVDFNYDLSIFTMDNMYQLIKNSSLASTNYLENSNTYYLKISDFEKIIYQKEIVNDEYIYITTYGEKTNRIFIDFNGYYDYKVNIELGS